VKAYVVRACQAALTGLLMVATPAALSADAVERLLEQGKAKLAAEVAAERLGSQPDDRHTRFLYGLALARSGQIDKAIEVYAELAEANPDRPEPANNLAVLYARKGDYEKARDWLEKAMATHPAYATAHRNLGDVYTALAAVAYSKALEEDRKGRDLGVDLSLVEKVYIRPEQRAPGRTQVAKADGRSGRTPQASGDRRSAGAESAAPPSQETSGQAKGPQIIEAPKPQPEPARPPQPERQTSQSEAEGEPERAGQSKPAPDTSGPAPDSDRAGDKLRRRILASVNGWSAAWSDQDLDSYLAAYADDFKPADGLTRSQWRARRRERVSSPQFIQVQVIEPEVELLEPGRAEVSFEQVYESDTYGDRVRKILTLEKRGEHWLIVREQSKPLQS